MRRSIGFALFALLLAAVPSAAKFQKEREKKEPDGPKAFWRAYSTTKDGKTELMVEGIYPLGGPGTVAILERMSPQGINPKILMLDLKMARLPGVWAAVIQPIPVYLKMPIAKAGQYESISILVPKGGSGNATINEIIDASAPKKE